MAHTSAVGARFAAAAEAMLDSAAVALEEHLGVAVGISLDEIRDGAVRSSESALEAEFSLSGAVEGRCVVAFETEPATTGGVSRTGELGAGSVHDEPDHSDSVELATHLMHGVVTVMSAALGGDVATGSGAVHAAGSVDEGGVVTLIGRATVGNAAAFPIRLQLARSIVETVGERWPGIEDPESHPSSSHPATHAVAPGPGQATDPVTGAMAVLGGVQLPVAVELGSVTCSIGELLRLAEGSVIPLRQGINEKATMLVNGTEVARGEMVVVDKKLGFRITETTFSIGR